MQTISSLKEKGIVMQPWTPGQKDRRVFVVRATDASSTSVEKALTEEILEATPSATGGFLVDTVGLSGSSLVCRTREEKRDACATVTFNFGRN